MVGTAADVGGGADVRNLSRLEADAWLLTVIKADQLGILDLGVGELDAKLAAIDATPDITLAILGDGSGMVGASAHGYDILAVEGGDLGGSGNRSIVLAGRPRVSGLTETVESPLQQH